MRNIFAYNAKMSLVQFAPHLDAFINVVRAGSFSSAARRLGVAPSSIVRQVDALEAELGTKLFVRSTRSLTLTDAGERLVPRASAILEQFTDARDEVAELGDVPQGTLRVSCLPTFSRRYLVPVVSDLLSRYPKLNVELEVTERVTDPSTERLDVAIRIGELPDSTLVATALAEQKSVICASPAYLAAHGVPKTVGELTGHRRIDKRHTPIGFGWNRVLTTEERAVFPATFRCDDYSASVDAARNGVGIAFLPTWVTGPDIKSGALVHLFDDPQGEIEPIQIVRSLRNPPPKLSVFIDALTKFIGKPPVWER
jgi:DNA-binding transcriptional LysR family regulator